MKRYTFFLLMGGSLFFVGLVLLTLVIGPLLPDAGQLVYVPVLTLDEEDIVAHDLARDLRYRLTPLQRREYGDLLWSTDGQQLLFTMVATSYVPPDLYIYSDIAFMEADGRSLRRFRLRNARRPVWSPAEDRLAYFIQEDENPISGVMVATLSTGDMTLITPPIEDLGPSHRWLNEYLAWSGDGRYVYAWARAGGKPATYRLDTQNPGTLDTIAAQFVHFSAEGVGVYLQDGDIYRLSDEGPPQNLTDSPEPEAALRWSPGGRWLAFVREMNRYRVDVFIMDATGETVRRLTSTGMNQAPTWSVDGQSVLFEYRPAVGVPYRLCMVSLDGGEPDCLLDEAPPIYALRPAAE